MDFPLLTSLLILFQFCCRISICVTFAFFAQRLLQPDRTDRFQVWPLIAIGKGCHPQIYFANIVFLFLPIGYLENEDALIKLGIDEVIIYSVNDGAVMKAWAVDQDIPKKGIITLMGDPLSELTTEWDMILDHPGPKSVGLINRCKRHAVYLENGEVKIVRVAEKEDDPAGDDFPEVTLAEEMISAIKDLGANGSKDEL